MYAVNWNSYRDLEDVSVKLSDENHMDDARKVENAVKIDMDALRLVCKWAKEYVEQKYKDGPLWGKIGDKNKLDDCMRIISNVEAIY